MHNLIALDPLETTAARAIRKDSGSKSTQTKRVYERVSSTRFWQFRWSWRDRSCFTVFRVRRMERTIKVFFLDCYRILLIAQAANNHFLWFWHFHGGVVAIIGIARHGWRINADGIFNIPRFIFRDFRGNSKVFRFTFL